MNREAWLQKATTAVRKAVFAPKGLTVPPVHVSVGFPSSKGLSLTQRSIGECWQPVSSADGVGQVFISPVVHEVPKVLAVLVHELLHAHTPGEKHGGMFKRLLPTVGLVGKPTHTEPGEALKAILVEVAGKLGPYPHSELKAGVKGKTQTTRLLKVECPGCGLVARVTAKWLDVTDLICGTDGVPLKRKDG